MYVFGGNDVNRTFSDLWRISLRHIVDCVRRQWYIENQEKNSTGESKNRYHFPEDTVTSLSRCPYKYPQWQCICRNSHLEGKWYFFIWNRLFLSLSIWSALDLLSPTYRVFLGLPFQTLINSECSVSKSPAPVPSLCDKNSGRKE